MPSSNAAPPPSYSEATSHVNSSSPIDEARPEGWVDGYVEAPRANDQAAAEHRPPVPVAEKSAAAAPGDSTGGSADASAATEDQPRSRLSFGGLDLGGRVLGYGNGEDVGGWGLKIGPVMLGLVDVEAEKLRREREAKKS